MQSTTVTSFFETSFPHVAFARITFKPDFGSRSVEWNTSGRNLCRKERAMNSIMPENTSHNHNTIAV